MQKLISMLGSRNAMITFLGIISLAFGSNDILLNGTPEDIYGTLTSPNIYLILMFLANPLIKLAEKIAKKEWSWAFLRSDNFRIQVGSALMLIFSSIFGEELAGMLVALVGNLYNFIIHASEKHE